MKFDFNDILIEPAFTTSISSRTQINPFDESGFLPLITAPMDTVVNKHNAKVFSDNKINVCLPRGEGRTKETDFRSYSLVQFIEYYLTGEKATNSGFKMYCLIDMANGHMKDLNTTVRQAKKLYGDEMVLMVGNIANPKTYEDLNVAGADYVRVGIGNGGGCLTTQQLGIGYPMGSLVKECYQIACRYNNPAKIVADGGMKDYSDIIKALALGADYVMLGSIFNKALESVSPCLTQTALGWDGWDEMNIEDAKWNLDNGRKVFKMFRGMSTKEVQKEWGVENPKTSEGIVKYQEVEYTLSGWVENFESYLRSAMSYTDSRTLKEFCGEVATIRITDNALNRFKK